MSLIFALWPAGIENYADSGNPRRSYGYVQPYFDPIHHHQRMKPYVVICCVTLKNLENSSVERIETFCAAGCAKRSLKMQQNWKDSRTIELHFRRHCNIVEDDLAKSAVRSWPATA